MSAAFENFKKVTVQILRGKKDLDTPVLIKNRVSYTTNDLIYHIENDTEIGADLLSLLINLTVDLLQRKKIEPEK